MIKVDILEILGFSTSLVYVWLNLKENIWAWFWAVVSSAISGIYFYKLNLLGDVNLQVFFIISSIFGFWQWKYGRKAKKGVRISRSPFRTLVYLWIVSSLGGIAIYYYLSGIRSDLVMLETVATTLSLAGTWLTARKYIESWLVWIITNGVYINIYLIKTAYLYSILYALFLFLAVLGYFAWQKKI